MPIDFGDIPVQVRPVEAWPGEETADRRPARFRAPWSDTLTLLKYEIEQLEPVRVMIHMDVPARMIRQDGLPRADANPTTPRVILWLELEPTRWARWPCDTFEDWQDNVRAIALTLTALRDMRRWGVSRGEQYEGYRQIPARTLASTPGMHSPQEAAAFLALWGGTKAPEEGERPAEAVVQAILIDEGARGIYYQRAARRLHPDTKGGSREKWDMLESAAKMLRLNADLIQPD